MDLKAYKNQIKENIIIPLKEYKKEMGKESGYTAYHIACVREILSAYLKKLDKMAYISNEKIMSVVEWAVVMLNRLNEGTQYCLIETDVRESIWEIIQNGAIDCGLQDYDGDITEEWREW